MLDPQERYERTLALNVAADSLGFDAPTRQAMTHVEHMVTVMSIADLTWLDVPEKFSVEQIMSERLGRATLQIVRAIDMGLDLVIQSERDESLGTSLLGAYAQCLEVAGPNSTMTLEQTFQTLMIDGAK